MSDWILPLKKLKKRNGFNLDTFVGNSMKLTNKRYFKLLCHKKALNRMI